MYLRDTRVVAHCDPHDRFPAPQLSQGEFVDLRRSTYGPWSSISD